jgi:hypothetical protein
VADNDWHQGGHFEAPPTTASPLNEHHQQPTQQLHAATGADPTQLASTQAAQPLDATQLAGTPPPADPTQYAYAPPQDQPPPPQNPTQFPHAAPPPLAPAAPAYSGYPQQRPTNTMAIASLVSSLIVAPLGIVFGHISLSQIKRTGEEGKGLAIAGLVIGYLATGFAIIALIFAVGFMALFTSAVHQVNSRHPSYTYPTPTTTASPIGVPDSSARVIHDAQVGDCIRRVTGARRSDGTLDVTVSSATCGSSLATDRVNMRTNSTSNCSGEWVQTKAYSPPIVLCLTKLR